MPPFRLPLRPSATQIQLTRLYSTPPPKPRVLAKPERFNPPSHPSRRRDPTSYDRPLGAQEKEMQKTRRYPHMMPPEGTFLHWFLTNRNIHLFISMSVLISLCVTLWVQDFLLNTPYRDLLPPKSMIFAHPIRFLGRWFEVYGMHVRYVSDQTAERRRRKLEDVEKRAAYRKAHGIETGGSFRTEDSSPLADDASPVAAHEPQAASGTAGQVQGSSQAEVTKPAAGVSQPARKWFGIF
ncbi:hypothetical protein K470DRAFT_168364 [Piedraia hortae CBS 480.64]|uniref:Uncharacterized protein n=1 Tax=Piedraia hortae CBS 480.64 TaxID=1314780 RepID=A0A6A7C5T1_9PEZI|nr:hypothetical protein K470DRAFT_168364 [Piedraia hortae CBS 480.64]